jgi:hypothetical protein
VAIILSLIWLKISKNKLPDEYGGMLLNRRLFEVVGEWLNQVDPAGEYDKAQMEFLMLDDSTENSYRNTI